MKHIKSFESNDTYYKKGNFVQLYKTTTNIFNNTAEIIEMTNNISLDQLEFIFEIISKNNNTNAYEVIKVYCKGSGLIERLSNTDEIEEYWYKKELIKYNI